MMQNENQSDIGECQNEYFREKRSQEKKVATDRHRILQRRAESVRSTQNEWVSDERAEEIVAVLVHYFGEQDRCDLVKRAILMASDKWRKMQAGKLPIKSIRTLRGVRGMDCVVGSLASDGVICVDNSTGKQLLRPGVVVIPPTSADHLRLNEIEMIELAEKRRANA